MHPENYGFIKSDILYRIIQGARLCVPLPSVLVVLAFHEKQSVIWCPFLYLARPWDALKFMLQSVLEDPHAYALRCIGDR